ncbi:MULTISPECIES: LuxR C-terminal-related transcriptional regulator [unclassified Chelatococcus]|uniref:LuxR C-terminal-related transcriptional regulator n=1 Tax=unclassified Chelatococcus TaxID=2638111 RepID=UPI001BCE1E9B|nr:MULTISPECIES: LuxR C-terminal-related transcriptional regulator [unclassified Chelatococcus]MBS7743469.1 hypothetical protein [Chelatococcus sp. HY11]MBX3547091.1 hypothetical protein [Chelatococcus sp.]CAH1663586.1 LuxR family maltose regulon positive regulatory protein [Hyphomicrobiales bacterium]CAH1687752.1 LuxR family maltose regulon positive regulatory protein [Hyphomicrobiales bacterium]
MLHAVGPIGEGLENVFLNEAYFNAEALIAAVIERLARTRQPVYLFLDDVHLLDQRTADLLALLIQRVPLNTHCVLATRQLHTIELGSMRAYGQLLELGHQELRFTRQEAIALLAGAGHHEFEVAHLDMLLSKTEGWVTGLKLACFALNRSTDRSDFFAHFSGRGRAVAAFFAEDVFARQSEEIRSFLLETAVLDRLSPELCDTLTGRRGSSATLRHLEEIGLFIAQLDDEGQWFRYHNLFSEFLQRKLADLDSQAVFVAHRKAAVWFHSRGHHEQALEHALKSRDFTLLSEYLEGVAEDFTYSGRVGTISKYAAELPLAILARSPNTAVAVAWHKIYGMRFRQTRHLLDLATERLAEMRRDPETDPDALEALDMTLQHREMTFAAAHDNLAQVEERCATLLRYFAPRRPFVVCSLYAYQMSARREHFRFEGLDRLHAQARASAEQSGYRFSVLAFQAAAGISLFAAGRTEQAREALAQGLDESHHWAGKNSPLAALIALPLAEIHYEANELEQSAELVDSHLPVARELCFVDQLVAGHIVKSRLHGARGDQDGARRALDQAMNVALECDLERMRLAVLHEQIRLLLRNGMTDAAAVRMAESNLPKSSGALAPNQGATTLNELAALIWARYAINRGQAAEALALTKQWRTFCQSRGAVRAFVRWSILAAQTLSISGDHRTAQRAMREGVTAAAPADLIRSFVDEGQPVFKLLSDAYTDSMDSQHPTDLFARRVLAAFTGKPVSTPEIVESNYEGLYGRLSGKELEILTLVGCGMRNREIGNRLGLSEGSVKWYMQQVYDKVGIRRRSQAVERARQFGLIA